MHLFFMLLVFKDRFYRCLKDIWIRKGLPPDLCFVSPQLEDGRIQLDFQVSCNKGVKHRVLGGGQLASHHSSRIYDMYGLREVMTFLSISFF